MRDMLYKVRKLLSDALSQQIFDMRIRNWEALVAGEQSAVAAFPETLCLSGLSEIEKARLVRLMGDLKNSSREKFIYGAGTGCRSVLQRETIAKADVWTGIIDNNVIGQRYGLPIISFDEFLCKHQDALVFNSIGKPIGETIHAQCVQNGVECLSYFEMDKSWDQYFDLPSQMGMLSDSEVFVQAGCYNGDTQKSFLLWAGGKYERMITFEPDPQQLSICRRNLTGLANVEVVEAGLSDCSGESRFMPIEMGLSEISPKGNTKIKTVALDDYMAGNKVTFIALDIEGAELSALKGAQKTIKQYRPKVAVSIYHKPEDLWQIPLFLKELHPDYQMYIRHYHLFDLAETVLYAL